MVATRTTAPTTTGCNETVSEVSMLTNVPHVMEFIYRTLMSMNSLLLIFGSITPASEQDMLEAIPAPIRSPKPLLGIALAPDTAVKEARLTSTGMRFITQPPAQGLVIPEELDAHNGPCVRDRLVSGSIPLGGGTCTSSGYFNCRCDVRAADTRHRRFDQALRYWAARCAIGLR